MSKYNQIDLSSKKAQKLIDAAEKAGKVVLKVTITGKLGKEEVTAEEAIDFEPGKNPAKTMANVKAEYEKSLKESESPWAKAKGLALEWEVIHDPNESDEDEDEDDDEDEAKPAPKKDKKDKKDDKKPAPKKFDVNATLKVFKAHIKDAELGPVAAFEYLCHAPSSEDMGLSKKDRAELVDSEAYGALLVKAGITAFGTIFAALSGMQDAKSVKAIATALANMADRAYQSEGDIDVDATVTALDAVTFGDADESEGEEDDEEEEEEEEKPAPKKGKGRTSKK